MSLRQIVLDTETTGLAVADGHRIVEIGLVELQDRRYTGRTFHTYLDPGRDIDEGAERVHGLSRERLQGEPKFAAIAERLLEFVAGAEVLIHNAPFDVAFLDAELAASGHQPFGAACAGVVDTLLLARELRPGQRNSLDVLCAHFGVSNEHRTFHGALLDAELLAEVYLRMTRGQEQLAIESGQVDSSGAGDLDWPLSTPLPVVRADASELAAHEAVLAGMEQRGQAALWVQLAAVTEPGSDGVAA